MARQQVKLLPLVAAFALVASLALAVTAQDEAVKERSFKIENDVFLKDGQPFQIIAGSIHYYRIHPAYWKDRLQKLRALGLNTITIYTPWNFHERDPGVFDFESERRDVVRFVELTAELGMLLILRPGPYICSEWDMGGMPWWLASSEVSGGRDMAIRTSDPRYMHHVERFWGRMLPMLAPHMYHRGGNIIMMQVENELGFFGKEKGVPVVRDYLRVLMALTRRLLDDQLLLFTTDPPYDIQYGTLPGDEVYSVVDFYPGTNLDDAFGVKQRSWNAPGKSPPFCSEFYTGFHPWFGNRMHQTDAHKLADSLADILAYANGTGSVNFYCISGGTNGFGLWSGASLFGRTYTPMSTTYDSGYPLSEAGDYGQPGLGGPNKYDLIRDVISRHTGVAPPAVPPRPEYRAYPPVHLRDSVPLMAALSALFPGDGIPSQQPLPAEEYGVRCGLILYRTNLPRSALGVEGDAVLPLADYVHDYSTVMLDGHVMGTSNRSDPNSAVHLRVQQGEGNGGDDLVLDILAEAMGRNNFFASGWDLKGIVKQGLALGEHVLEGWRVFPIGLEEDFAQHFPWGLAGGAGGNGPQQEEEEGQEHEGEAGQEEEQEQGKGRGGSARRDDSGSRQLKQGPVFYRGVLHIGEEHGTLTGSGHLPDTYLAVQGWGKGIAWVNGVNLGWYWPEVGPQRTLYIPGPVLRCGENEVIMLELHREREDQTVGFADVMDWGPVDPPPTANGAACPKASNADDYKTAARQFDAAAASK